MKPQQAFRALSPEQTLIHKPIKRHMVRNVVLLQILLRWHIALGQTPARVPAILGVPPGVGVLAGQFLDDRAELRSVASLHHDGARNVLDLQRLLLLG